MTSYDLTTVSTPTIRLFTLICYDYENNLHINCLQTKSRASIQQNGAACKIWAQGLVLVTPTDVYIYKLVRLIADTVCGAANVKKRKDTTHPQSHPHIPDEPPNAAENCYRILLSRGVQRH